MLSLLHFGWKVKYGQPQENSKTWYTYMLTVSKKGFKVFVECFSL
jgi:hypothetical protein